ncbi:MAG: GNAT family N-acetyltransferase [Actinomycetes bacterium]
MSAAGSEVSSPAGDFVLRREPYDSDAAAQLVELVQQEYVVRYGGPDGTPVDPAEFAAPGGAFLVGYHLADGVERPIACGGVRRYEPAVGELKRMFVDPAHRRQGLSRVLLAALEDTARSLGYAELCLETGDRQPEAMALYASSGYRRVAPYGYYRCAPGSACFAKDLAVPGAD